MYSETVKPPIKGVLRSRQVFYKTHGTESTDPNVTVESKGE
jgi:hypothetical protein